MSTHRAHNMPKPYFGWLVRPMLLAALLLCIPAFYLVMSDPQSAYRSLGFASYGLAAILIGAEWFIRHQHPTFRGKNERVQLDALIFFGALVSAWPTSFSWPFIEWLLRLTFCAIVFLRLATLLGRYVAPHRLLQMVAMALFLLAIAGEGFLLLEPKVHTYADGVWLAFLTCATLGYGDIVPTTPASRIFAVFIVLLGYALFSVVTASISAILVGEDEKIIRKELHADTRMLRAEIAALRKELRSAVGSKPELPN
ncbi:potassium channel family protein [Herbaspirillum sp. RTI4]|uniref:potassium channel family protein n=1 Tax=Herbaspirillum sp. RTI4 TaxID=3048640 RepID=UPI002AB37E2A|nr:potassium channel family protein [Herbaspirillum sp. RTI4]MDY7578940.1 potassium channel family protein [Herbaspirillum sp. RTI4]MEA9982029.1 potassium channel family protein [Herbaspirillum sp. RTI4]